MADFSSLKTAIQNAIRTNGNNEITGQLLQDILLSMVVVLGDEAITNVADDLSTETSQRQNADGTLQGNINAEATARAVADTALQNAINTINSNISNGYVYAGIATPSATPVTGKVFYIATTAGTYTNFGGLTVTKGINILKYNGSTWSQEQIIGIDDYPTAGSSKLALSGGIDAEIKSLVGYYTCGTAAATAAKTITASAYILLQGGSIKVKFTYKNTAADATLKIGSADAKPLFYGGRRAGSSNSWEAGEVVEIFYDGTNYMANNVMGGGAGDGVFDISVYNAVDGTPTPYTGLTDALGVNGANVPENYRKGGMSVKFVLSSDNKYAQARCMAQDFTTDVTQWQGVDDKIIAGSRNLVESGCVADVIYEFEEVTSSRKSKLIFTAESPVIAAHSSSSSIIKYYDCNAGDIMKVEGTFIPGGYNTSLNVGFTTELPVAGVSVSNVKTFSVDVNNAFVAPSDGYIVIYYYVPNWSDVLIKKGIEKTEKVRDELNAKIENLPVFSFADDAPFIKELYINQDGVDGHVEKVHSVHISDNLVRVRFCNSASDTFTGNTDSYTSKEAASGILPIKQNGDVVGYVIVDWNKVEQDKVIGKSINPIGYDVAYSPTIYASLSGIEIKEQVDNIEEQVDNIEEQVDNIEYKYIYTDLSYSSKSRLYFSDTQNPIIASVSTASVKYYPCNTGDVFRVIADYELVTANIKLGIGFTTEIPAEGVQVTLVDIFDGVDVDKIYTAPINGYIVVSFSTYCWQNLIIQSVEKIKKMLGEKKLAYNNMTTMVVLGSSLTQSTIHPKYTGWVSKLNEQTDIVMINGGHGGFSPLKSVDEFVAGTALLLNPNVAFSELSPSYVFMCNQANSAQTKAAIYDQIERLNNAVKALGSQLVLGAEEYWPGPNGNNPHDGIKPYYLSAAKAFNIPISNIGKTIIDKCFKKTSQPNGFIYIHHANYRGTFSHIAHLDLINTLPVKQSIKMFRVRPENEDAQITDLVYSSVYDRISKFVSISAGECNVTYDNNGVDYHVGYEDADTISALQYALPGSVDIPQSGSLSETADMVAGRSIGFNKYALMECLFDGTPTDIDFKVETSGSITGVYYLNGSNVWAAIDAQINTSDISFSMNVPYGALSNGRLKLLFASAGEFSLAKPVFVYNSENSRTFNSAAYNKRLFGTELMSDTNPTNIFTLNTDASNISFPTGLETYSDYNNTQAVVKLVNEGSIEHVVQIPNTAKKVIFRIVAQAFNKVATTQYSASDPAYADFVTNDVPELTIGENDYGKVLITAERYKTNSGGSLSGKMGEFVKESLVGNGWSEIYFEYDNEYDDNDVYPYLKIMLKRELYGKLPILIHDVSVQTI